MAAVAAEPGAAAVSTTTTAVTFDDGQPEPSPVGSGPLGSTAEPNGALELGTGSKLEDGASGEGRHIRPELEPAAGIESPESGVPVDHSGTERFSPGLPADSESGVPVERSGTERLSPGPYPQHSAVFLHSFPNLPPVTEAGLSLAEPAEPTTNETTDRDRGFTLLQAELGPGAAERPEPEDGYCESSAGREDPTGRSEVLSPPGHEGFTVPGPASVRDLSAGTEVRVCLDHVIDDALVVSFRLGEQVFSGVLMDVSRRFGPYGIPITVFPRRDDHSRPSESLQPITVSDKISTEQEEVVAASPSPPLPQPWTSKPPPLFQEGAPYPPPLFIRDSYNQALPQPLPRKIKRPKRRYRCEEPTSIMNAIKLRPRQVLCDKCKGVVASGGHREARRGPVELRCDEAARRRRAVDTPMSSELKRLRSDDKGRRSFVNRHSSSVIHVSSSSTSSRRVLRGVASSSSVSSSHVHLKLNSKKVLAKGSTAEPSKAQQVIQKLASHCRTTSRDKNQNQDHSKAVTRAAALQNHNQKVHFTRRLQSLSSTSISTHTPLPPRMRLKPQRYRTDEPAPQPASASPPKPATSPTHTPPPSVAAPPPSSTDNVTIEMPEDEGVGQRAEWHEVEPPPPSSSSLDSSHSECSSTETFDLPPPGDLPLSSSCPAPLPPPSPSTALPPCCPASSSPALPTADGEDEEEGGDLKRQRKSSTSSSSSSSSLSSVFSKSVSKCLLPDGRTVCVGDIVWAKIYGFPWWPARVLGIMVARRGDTGLAVRQEARVSWFGSPTTSYLALTQLSPFLETFQLRFDKKRKGPYRRAIAEAASAAKQLTPEVRSLLTQFET